MSEWSYRKGITIDSAKVGGDLTDFPVVIHLNNDSGLADHAQSSGDDIKFEDANGNQLSHEIEAYDGSTGTLWAHVKVPSLSASSDTTIYIYYGNDSASNQESVADVWSNGYAGVWHFNENSGPFSDSTTNGNTATNSGSADIAAQLDGGQSFDGDDKVNVDDSPSMRVADDPFFASVWVDPDNISDIKEFLGTQSTIVGSTGWRLNFSGGDIQAWINNGNDENISLSTSTEPQFIAANYDLGNQLTLYRNETTNTTSIGTGSAEIGFGLGIGQISSAARAHNGWLDEVRLVSTTRTTEWVTATYRNQDEPLSFYSIGGLESLNNRAITTTGSETTSLSTQTATRNAPASAVSGATVQSTASNVSATVVDATATADLTTTLQTPSVAALTPTALTTETATTATEQARASVTTAKSTAIETKSRILKFADATATATVSLEVSVPPPNTPAAALITASPRAALTPRKTTSHRRALDGTSDTDAAYETDSDRVEYDEQTDEIEYDTR